MIIPSKCSECPAIAYNTQGGYDTCSVMTGPTSIIRYPSKRHNDCPIFNEQLRSDYEYLPPLFRRFYDVFTELEK